MRNVIRNQETGEIQWVLFAVHEGVYYWLTKEARDKMYELGRDNLAQYYSGDAEDEVVSLMDDLSLVITGEVSKEYITLVIARGSDHINWQEDVLTTQGNPNN